MLVVTRSAATWTSTCLSNDDVSWSLFATSARAATTRRTGREAGAVVGAVVGSVDGAVVVVVGSPAHARHGQCARRSSWTRITSAQRGRGIRRCFRRAGALRQGQNQTADDSNSAGAAQA